MLDAADARTRRLDVFRPLGLRPEAENTDAGDSIVCRAATAFPMPAHQAQDGLLYRNAPLHLLESYSSRASLPSVAFQ